MKDKIHHLFVYGTLKEGRPLDRKMFANVRLSVKPATITGDIYHVNFYPGIKLGGKNLAHGEIHEFDSKDMKTLLPIFDSIEGYREGQPEERNLFNRKIVKAKLDNGKEIDAYVYEYNGKVDKAQLVKSGLWEPK